MTRFVNPGINLFLDFGRIKGWVGSAAQGDLEIWLCDLQGQSNPGHLHGSATVGDKVTDNSCSK